MSWQSYVVAIQPSIFAWCVFKEETGMRAFSIQRTFIRSNGVGCFKATGLLVLMVLIGFLAVAHGQSTTGTLTGTVTDPQGAAMVGVMVTVHNADTGVDQ